MPMKTSTYVALGALVVAGGATAYKVLHKDPHVATGKLVGSPLPALKKASIDEIVIEEKGKPAVDLKKDGAEWKLVAPVADRADQTAVDAALDALEKLKLKDVIAEHAESYDKVGVKDDEVVKIVPRTGGKDLVTLLVGKTTNVRVGQDPRVWSTIDLRRWELVKETKLWRDREIVKAEADKIAQIDVAYDGAKVVVKKEAPPAPASQPAADPKAPPPPAPPDKWTVVEGADKIGGTLDPNVAIGLANTLTHLEADDFAADDAKPEATGLDHPRATVTATMKDGSTKAVLLGKQEGEAVYAKRPDGPRVWKLRKWDAERIPASPAQWRDKTLVKIAPGDVVKLDLEKGAEKVHLERPAADKPWKATPADFGEVDDTKVAALLNVTLDLAALRIADNPDAKATGFDKPQAVLTFTRKDGTTEKLVIGAKAQNEETFVQKGKGGDVYVVTGAIANGLMVAPSSLKKGGGSPAKPAKADKADKPGKADKPEPAAKPKAGPG